MPNFMMSLIEVRARQMKQASEPKVSDDTVTAEVEGEEDTDVATWGA